MMNSVEICQKRGKSNQKIRDFHYCLWARELMRKEIGSTKAQYGFPKSLLALIRDISLETLLERLKKTPMKSTFQYSAKLKE